MEKIVSEIYNITKIIKDNNLDFSKCMILDVGCGSGKHGRIFAPFCTEYIGIDRDPQSIIKAKEMTSVAYTNLHFYNSTIKHNKLNKKFNIILQFRSFHYIENHQQYIDEMKEFLEDDGICIIVEPYNLDIVMWADDKLNKSSILFEQEKYDEKILDIKNATTFLLNMKNIKHHIIDNFYYFILSK